jgi:hypothetical protein
MTMTAHDYLRFLEQLTVQDREALAGMDLREMRRQNHEEWSRIRIRQWTDASLGDERADEAEWSAHYKRVWDEIDKNPANYAGDYLTRFLSPFLAALSDDVREQVGHVPIGILPIRALNAHCIRSPGGAPIIVFNTGMFTMLSYYIESMFDTAFLQEHLPHVVQSHLLATYRFIVDYFRADGNLPFPNKPLSKTEVRYGHVLGAAIAAELFVLAHEFAHVYAGHLDRSGSRSVALSGSRAESIDFFENSHEQEYEADTMGWQWFQQARGAVPLLRSFDDELMESGPLCFLLVLALIERNVAVPDQYSTHPPAVDRLRRLAPMMKLSAVATARYVLMAETFPQLSGGSP